MPNRTAFELRLTMHHIYLSPHLDDAVYSCGGRMFRQRREDEPVTVVNFLSGTQPEGELSAFARQYHEMWGNPSNAVALRRQEDMEALSRWGVQAIYWDSSDAIYRQIHGTPLYPNVSSLFGTPHPEDERELLTCWNETWTRLRFSPEQVHLYAPLGAGNHVDHVLVRKFAQQLKRQGWRVWFYEDFPHAYDSRTLQEALNGFGNVRWKSHTELIDAEEKVKAMWIYASQISMMFSDREDLRKRVKDFSAERAVDIHWGERLRKILAGSGGRRERIWRRLFGYLAHAERYWSYE